MQNKVMKFNQNKNCHKKPVPLPSRILNIQSELGELAKAYLENSKYGTQSFELKDDFKEEFGDVLYTILSLANELNISCEQCLDIAIEKYNKRINKGNSMKSGK